MEKETDMTRPMNIAEKILAAHAGLEEVVPGQLITAKVDITLANDITGPVAVREFKKIGANLQICSEVLRDYFITKPCGIRFLITQTRVFLPL